MAGVITTGSNPKALLPGIKAFWGMAYDEYKPEWKSCFKLDTSERNYEEVVAMTGMGLAPVKGEGAALMNDDMKQAYVTRFINIAYALGYAITREEMADVLYPQLARQRTEALAFSMHQTKENVAANIFNRAYDGAYLGGDGVCMVSAAHPTEGGVQSNTLAVAADLSEASLEDALIDISNFRDNRNNHISIKGQSLLVPWQLVFEATRILRNPERPDTADRDINAIYTLGLLPGGIIGSHYLTDTDAWFVLTNIPSGLMYFEREAVRIENDNDFYTKNELVSAYERYAFGWADWRGVYGSPGV
uniref:Putative capsid protein n=1 Tax=viral metagenome TaxID=1070528 RepID=A0A6M3KPZ3_9ZZZZ